MRHTVLWFVVTDLLGENICTIKKNTAALVVASKEMEVEAEVNNEKLRT
jgi:hypothetical protein